MRRGFRHPRHPHIVNHFRESKRESHVPMTPHDARVLIDRTGGYNHAPEVYPQPALPKRIPGKSEEKPVRNIVEHIPAVPVYEHGTGFINSGLDRHPGGKHRRETGIFGTTLNKMKERIRAHSRA